MPGPLSETATATAFGRSLTEIVTSPPSGVNYGVTHEVFQYPLNKPNVAHGNRRGRADLNIQGNILALGLERESLRGILHQLG